MTRRALDAYYTDETLADALVGLLDIRPGVLAWEPHAGGGAFVRALHARGAVVTASDVDPDAPAMQAGGVPDGCPSFVGDFLAHPPEADNAPEWIVGNPPFKGFEAHLDHALAWAPRVAFLLRLGAMESQGRVSAWKRWPLRRVWVLARRPSFTGGRTDSAVYGWFYFLRHFDGPADIIPGWTYESR